MDSTLPVDELQAAAEGDAAQPTEMGNIRPDRLAWLVLWAAFAVFCTLTFILAFAVYFFLFQSTVAMPATLYVAKGTVGITGADLIETVERESETLTNKPTTISTDSLSQAIVQFRVTDSADEALLAALTLQGGTSITFAQANRPRYGWSQNPLQIRFTRLRGEVDILVPGSAERALQMRIFAGEGLGDDGVLVEIVERGRYRLQVSEDALRLHSLRGSARAAFLGDDGQAATISGGQVMHMRLVQRTVELQAAPQNIVRHGHFTLDAMGVSEAWHCRAWQQQAPAGTVSFRRFDARSAVGLRRVNNAQSNGQVRCTQNFEDGGLDVGGIDSLRVLATLRPNYQSLSVCGQEASECPLMLKLDYEDSLGRAISWYRGFYYAEDVSGNARRRCDSCIQDHVEINQGVWYTFDSDNLIRLIAEAVRPVRIKSLSFYASGHQFDTSVSEVLLLLDME